MFYLLDTLRTLSLLMLRIGTRGSDGIAVKRWQVVVIHVPAHELVAIVLRHVTCEEGM